MLRELGTSDPTGVCSRMNAACDLSRGRYCCCVLTTAGRNLAAFRHAQPID